MFSPSELNALEGFTIYRVNIYFDRRICKY